MRRKTSIAILIPALCIVACAGKDDATPAAATPVAAAATPPAPESAPPGATLPPAASTIPGEAAPDREATNNAPPEGAGSPADAAQ